MSDFPISLIPHQPAPDGLAITLFNLCKRQTQEIGPARQRHAVANGSLFVDQVFAFTNPEYEYFRAWHLHGIRGGASWFDIPLFLGSDYSTVTARFVKAGVTPKRGDGGWLVPAKLELTDLPTISSGTLTGLIGAAGSGLPAWPDTVLLPNPLDDEFAHAIGDGLLRGDEGPLPDQDRFAVVMPSIMGFAWPFQWTAFETFKGFLKHRLSWGRRWFTLPVFRGTAFVSVPVRFVMGSLTATREGPEWVVRGQLEMRQLPTLTEADAEALL